MVCAPEIERRQNHINKIDPKNPLLSIALDCLKDKENERPSAHQFCEQVVALKQSDDYTSSMSSQKRGVSSEPHTSEIQTEKGQTLRELELHNQQLTQKLKK